MNNRPQQIFIGDVHGCLEELITLLSRLEYNSACDTLVFVGDLVDRGPESVGVVRHVRELQAEHGQEKVQCVMGNHEEKYVLSASPDGGPW